MTTKYVNQITPRSDQTVQHESPAIFLAGTIDMGHSIDWQADMVSRLEADKVRLNVFNPRRQGFPDFDKAEQHHQITWELDALHNKFKLLEAVFFNFVSTSKSPITLLELGFCLPILKKMNIVVCDPSFYRYDNVKLTCDIYDVPVYHTLDEGYDRLASLLKPFTGF